MHRWMILYMIKSELAKGPLVVKGENIGRVEVHSLEGDVMVGLVGSGHTVRIPYDSTMGLTGARYLSDPDLQDVWIWYGPSRHAVAGRPPLTAISPGYDFSIPAPRRL
jgi:hypothetical protein